MIRLLNGFRLIPVVLVAAVCLFTLKIFGLVFEGGYILNDAALHAGEDITGSVDPKRRVGAAPAAQARPPVPAKRSWAQEMFNYPDITGSVGSAGPPKPAAAAKENKAAPTPHDPAAAAPPPPPRPISAAERAILERLQERRSELEARANDLDMRENLLKAAEKRLEARVTELKELEARVNEAAQAKTEADAARFKNLVTMYDAMKAKDAAKIFDRLDQRVLVSVATQLNPRRMSDILAQMTPDAAERLTVALAERAKANASTAELPKIEGRPNTN